MKRPNTDDLVSVNCTNPKLPMADTATNNLTGMTAIVTVDQAGELQLADASMVQALPSHEAVGVAQRA